MAYFVDKLKFDAVDLSNIQTIITLLYSLLLIFYERIFKKVEFIKTASISLGILIAISLINDYYSYYNYKNLSKLAIVLVILVPLNIS